MRSPTTVITLSPLTVASRSEDLASVTTVQPCSARARVSARPSPADPPVISATDIIPPGDSAMPRLLCAGPTPVSLEGQVHLKSRGSDGQPGRPDRERSCSAQRLRILGPPLLREPGTDPGDPQRRRPASIPAPGAATPRVHPRGRERRPHPRGDSCRARPSTFGAHTQPGGLAGDQPALARPPERADPSPGAAARRARLLHRLRLPLHRPLCHLQPERPRRTVRRRTGSGVPSPRTASATDPAPHLTTARPTECAAKRDPDRLAAVLPARIRLRTT